MAEVGVKAERKSLGVNILERMSDNRLTSGLVVDAEPSRV